ncbi:MAG: HisA/HisF-related TIM barrel protein [Candidatus Methanoperedens sp.]|nr:HisA/HisF-related TIM barrel protein [Candidatus Methanoperedens sp.]
MFRIVFVIDILHGNAVHAIRGERSKYMPVKNSVICRSSDPLDMVSALKPREVYIADLDRLLRIGDNLELIRKISAGTETMVDTGASDLEDVRKYARIADTVILGTETVSLELIEQASGLFSGRINVSIDIRSRKVLTQDRALDMEPEKLAELLNDYDILDIIALDLGKVGTGTGIDIELLGSIAASSDHGVLAGGGIRGMDDIDALEKIGIKGALAATAVHEGRIPLELFR